ncbi:cold shock domain [Amphidinium carterae]
MASTGVVKKWNEEKGFGFISPENGGDDLFAHRTALMDDLKSLVEGDKVEFDERYDERKGKTRAENVRVMGGGGGGGGGGRRSRSRSPPRRGW